MRFGDIHLLRKMQTILNIGIISILIIYVPKSMGLEGYNEPCELYDETSPCDHTIGLMCIDSGIKGYRCKCPTDNQFATLYDSRRNRCVGKVFNNCVRSPSPGNSNSTYCVENAECNISVYYLPICICKKGFYEMDDGTCATVAKYGESCDNAQCDTKYGITCHKEGKCGCKDTSNQFYDSREEKCITYVGGNCSLEESLCVANAECTKIPKFPMANPLKRTIIFGSEEDTKNAEISFSAGRDSPPTGSMRPGPYRGTDPQAKCMCKSGFSKTSEGFCMKGYGNICKMMADRNSTETCNPDQFLECLDGHDGHFRCQCRNPLNERWDDTRKQCVSMIGKKCRPFPSYPKCDAGGECINETCHCKSGTSLTPIGTCTLDYNERCRAGECNVYSGLTCHGKTGTCLCLDSYLKYDTKKKACLASIGSPCGSVDLMGFQGRGFDNRLTNNGGPNGGAGIPFIGCDEGATCSPQVSGKRMIHNCVRNKA